jgi:hypothetical protein
MESCASVAGTRHPGAPCGLQLAAGQAEPGRIRSALGSPHWAGMVEDSATLPSSKSRHLGTPLTTLPPLMVRYAFRVGESGRDLSHAENISSTAVADREACEPFLPPSLTSLMPMTTPLSLTFSLTMSSAGRMFAARLREPTRNHVQVAVHLWLGASCFSCMKRFQGD